MANRDKIDGGKKRWLIAEFHGNKETNLHNVEFAPKNAQRECKAQTTNRS